MEQYFITLKTLIENISIPGAAVAVSYFIFKTIGPTIPAFNDWLRSKNQQPQETNDKGEIITLATIDERVRLLSSNHFHELRESLSRIERAIQDGTRENNRTQSEILQKLAIIVGRINGKNY
jgi:hypothetical protein